MSNSSIWLIDWSLSGATTPGQSGLGSNGIERVLRIHQRSSLTGASPSDCLMWYQGHLFGRVLPFCRSAVGVFHSTSQLGGFLSVTLQKIPNISKLNLVSYKVIYLWEIWFSRTLKLYLWKVILITGFHWTRMNNFYHSGFSDYRLHLYCYIHDVSADKSSDLLKKIRDMNLSKKSCIIVVIIVM